MRTWIPTEESTIEQKWWLVDATDKTLGDIAVKVARKLRGKDKAEFTPGVDTGDFVVVVNCEKLRLTGNKLIAKKYYRHSGYMGGLKQKSAMEMVTEQPEVMLTKAVHGMLPDNNLSEKLIKKLKVYRGAAHPHAAQRPEALS